MGSAFRKEEENCCWKETENEGCLRRDDLNKTVFGEQKSQCKGATSLTSNEL